MTDLIIIAKQKGWDLLPDNAQWQYRIQIRSETSDSLYIVSQNKANKKWACSCLGWRSHRHCKHLSAMVGLLTQLTSSTRKALK